MQEILLAFIAGLIVGGIFSFIKLPIPAPQSIAGVMGIVGLFCGYLLISRLIS